MKVNLPIIFNQLEDRYKTLILGLNKEATYSLYNYGCTLFDIAAALRYYGHDETPETLNQKLIQLSNDTDCQFGFVKNTGIYIWGSLNKLFPDIQERRVLTPGPLTDDQVRDITKSLDQGFPVLVEVDYNPKTLPIEMHFLNIVDYSPTDEDAMTGADPLGGKLIPMKTYFSWAKMGIRKIIEQYVVISGPVPKPSEPVHAPEPAPVIPATPIEPTPPVDAPVVPESPSVPSNPQPPADSQPETPTPPQPAEPSPEVPPAQPTEPSPEVATNASMAEVLASVVDYLGIEKDPKDTTLEDIRRRFAGVKSTATDYWNQKEAAEKKLVAVEPTLKSFADTISNLEGELTRQMKDHKAEVEAIESTVQSPRNLKKQFDAIYNELKGKHDGYFAELVELRKENMVLKREIEQLNSVPTDPIDPPATPAIPRPPVNDIDKGSFFSSIMKGIKSFFVLKW